MTDEQLIPLCRAGDKNAWEELYLRYKPRVLKIARRFFLSGGETEDLVQEGMCGLYSAVNGYNQSREGFPAYAYSCIRNRITDAVKKSLGAKHSALNNFLPIAEGVDEWTSHINPEDELIFSEDKRELLVRMSKALSALEFKAIVMYVDGMTLVEISSALDKSFKSVDNAINRAKHKIQTLISAEE